MQFRTQGRGALMALLMLCIGGAQAQDSWITDDKGCKHALVGQPGATVTWTGGCVNNLAEGDGTQQWVSARGAPALAFVGTLVGGVRHGKGALRLANGSLLESEFVDGKSRGPTQLVSASGERREVKPASRPDITGKAEEICTRIGKPDVPALDWKGHAAYGALAVVKGGRVVSIEVRVLEGGIPREVQRTLVTAVQQALRERYECPGDHVFEQRFDFNYGV